MSELSAAVLQSLLRTTLFLAAAVAVVHCVLRLSRCQSPRLHRVAWGAALLQGFLLFQIPLTISWDPWGSLKKSHESEASLPIEAIETASFSADPSAATEFATLPRQAYQSDQPSALLSRPAKAPAVSIKKTWPLAIVVVWLGGMAVILCLGVRRYLRFANRLPPSREILPQWQREFDDLVGRINRRGTISLAVVPEIGPLLYRRRRGCSLIVPEALWRSLTSPERIAILRHELGHFQRGDLWKSLVARLLALPHWFNPAAWYAVRRFDEAAEWACDGLVIVDETAATEYAGALLKLCESPKQNYTFLPAAHGSSVARRIRRILSQAKEDSSMKKFTVCTAVALVLAVGLFRVQLVGEEVMAEAKPSRQIQAMIDAAKSEVEATQAAYDAGTTTIDVLYVWSRRLLQASVAGAPNQKQRLDAYLAHRGRMAQLFLKVSALFHGEAKGGEADKYYAAKFYLAEANMWLFEKFGKEFEPIPAERLRPIRHELRNEESAR